MAVGGHRLLQICPDSHEGLVAEAGRNTEFIHNLCRHLLSTGNDDKKLTEYVDQVSSTSQILC